jgi:predicted aspartyl protease
VRIAPLIVLAAMCLPAAAAAECRMQRFAEWPVRVEDGRLVADALINGRKAVVMLHTGMPHSLMPRAQADALGVPRRQQLDKRSATVPTELAFAEQVKIGDATHKDWRMLVFALPEYASNVAAVIGYDALRQADVEFDLANNVVRLFRTQDCGPGANLAYWNRAGAEAVKLGGDDDGISLDVGLNGQPVAAEINTGFARSAVSRRFGAVETFTLASERVSKPALQPADTYYGYQTGSFVLKRELKPVQLGLDFLRSHRVLVAHSQGRVYFTYLGGPIFNP